jgi:hypothetical protein
MKYFDRVKETATTTGTGDFTLAGAATGFRTFASVLSTNDTCYYCIALQGGSEWEVGLGTYSAANTLTRTTVLSSSNSGSAVNFSAGTKDVFLTVAARRFETVDLSGASSDYLLQPGETAKIDFSSATSIPLHIGTVEGAVYEFVVVGDITGSLTASVTSLVPNSGGLAAGCINQLQFYCSGSMSESSSGVNTSAAKIKGNVFKLSDLNYIFMEGKISTSVKAKSIFVKSSLIPLSDVSQFNNIAGFWNDSTTAWTSLGTITNTVAHSGTIIIKRVF